MLYVSDCMEDFVVTDSETGETFEVASGHGLYPVTYYRNGVPFDLRSVLGYVKYGRITIVSEYLVVLLGYIDDIDIIDTKEVKRDSIRICSSGHNMVSNGNIIVRFNGMGVFFTVLDLVMIASYDESFWELLKVGVLNLWLGWGEYYVIKFCGKYMPCIAKLVSTYRESDELQILRSNLM